MGGKSQEGGGGPPLDAAGADYLQRYPGTAEFSAGPLAHYQQFGQAEGKTYGLQSEPFAFPEFPSFESSSSDYAAQLAKAEADRVKTQGLNDRDALYSDYISAASSATDYINTQVTQERANARLLGIDYNITDEQKGTRISDYFASIWGEGDQTRLEGLFSDFGDPEDFEGFSISRGTASTQEDEGGGPEVKSKTKGQRPALTSTEDEKDKLSKSSILGG